jgi:SRSO17 transposase
LIDQTATARVQRLIRWLAQFKQCFGHRAQLLSLRTYVQGVFSDSERTSMQAMLARVTEPVSYQAFQHFMTHAPWEADRVWRRLRAVVPECRGVLILDGTSFPKQGPASVGVARQYCGALGKIANCQVAVTAALWTGGRAWCLGATLYLPEDWLTPPARRRARIPPSVRFQEKGRLALSLLRQARAAGLALTAVLADAEFGDVTAFRAALHRLRLPYAVGISSQLTVFTTRPRVTTPAAHRRGRPRTRVKMVTPVPAIAVRAWAAQVPPARWRRITWRNGPQPARTARFAAVRVTPAHEWRHARLAPEIWLLCEEEAATKPRVKYYFVHLPATASLRALVTLAHQRWAIEQQYQELKSELGLDHSRAGRIPAGSTMSC